MNSKLRDLLVCLGVKIENVDSIVEEISGWVAELSRQERLVKSFFGCAVCQCRVEVVLDIGASNCCNVNGTCPQCGTRHAVQFIRTIEPKVIRPDLRPTEINGRLF